MSERHPDHFCEANVNEAERREAVAAAPETQEQAVARRIRQLRSQISDVGSDIDTRKTKVAAAFGGGVFLALLALLAAYDLYTGKAGLWLSVGVTTTNLQWFAMGLALLALVCFVKGIGWQRAPDKETAARLEELQRELERHLARQTFLESEKREKQ